jgi:RNA polymerase sigma-70 factor (ECF subfamily)
MKSFEELCQENYKRIYKYIFTMAGSKEVTEDLIQDVFTVAYEKGEAFLQHEKPTAFLYRTARNLTITYLKRQRISAMESLSEDIVGDGTDLCEKLLMDIDQEIDETAYTGQVVGSLDLNQHKLYTQRYIEKKPIKEIAFEQGVSETAMRMRLVRLRREIQCIVKDLKLDEK